MTADLELRTCTPDDFDELAVLIMGAFLDDVEEGVTDLHRLVHEPERTHVITDSARMVATGTVYTRGMTIPGAAVPVAHVSGVAVASTHRRRGLLSRIMTAQLEAIRDRGTEPVAALWASEGAIYGRFGYGVAAWHVSYRIPTTETTLPGQTPTGRLTPAVPSDVLEELAEVYDRARVERPGYSARPGKWWQRLTSDPKASRRGYTALRAVLHEVDGTVDGFTLWRAKRGWNDTGPAGQIDVSEVVATSTEAYTALWRFLLSIDLTRTVKYEFGAVDEPLLHLVTNPSGIGGMVGPSLWIRIVDVPAALAARRYATPVDVVLDVSDAMLPANAGRWHLVGDATFAKCEPTDAEPHVSFDVRQLGAVYLGGTSLRSLADAGLVTEHRAGSIDAVSVAFGWHRAPATIEIF